LIFRTIRESVIRVGVRCRFDGLKAAVDQALDGFAAGRNGEPFLRRRS
jgi:hypothetical protein